MDRPAKDMAVGIETFGRLEAGGGHVSVDTGLVAEEIPVALTYNGLSHVVMMMTPSDLEDFVIGFSLCEGIIDRADDLTELDVRPVEPGYLVSAQVPQENFERLTKRRRNLIGQSGCGICGVVELENAILPVSKIAPSGVYPSAEVLFSSLASIQTNQPLNAQTGAMHGAAFLGMAGEIVAVREDVGRHNALDKLIGHLARTDKPFSEGFVLLTSRCGVELAQKVIAVGIPMLVTISAPTRLAIALAREADLTLICLARQDSVLLYSDPHGTYDGETVA